MDRDIKLALQGDHEAAKLTHLSLFSGIGGLDLAAEMAGFRTVGQCEWANYPTKVLEKHWPDVPRWRDIRTLTGGSFFERTGLRTVDVISGGFPCQPFSVAGKRRGKEDDRYLWPEMLRVIRELRPRWVVGENVAGIINMALDTVLADLEGEGYATGTLVLPACGVDAPHRRYRVAIVGYAEHDGLSAPAQPSRKGRKRPANLREQVCAETVRLWPTPRAADSSGTGAAGSKSAEHDLERQNLKGVVMYTPGAEPGEQLNPDWVEWLMGFPPGWTRV